MRRIWIVSMQPYAEADAKETAKQKAEEEAMAAAKTNGAGAAADAAAKKDGKKEKKVGRWPLANRVLDVQQCTDSPEWLHGGAAVALWGPCSSVDEIGPCESGRANTELSITSAGGEEDEGPCGCGAGEVLHHHLQPLGARHSVSTSQLLWASKLSVLLCPILTQWQTMD